MNKNILDHQAQSWPSGILCFFVVLPIVFACMQGCSDEAPQHSQDRSVHSDTIEYALNIERGNVYHVVEHDYGSNLPNGTILENHRFLISEDIPGPGIHSAEAIAQGAHIPVVFSVVLGKGIPYQNALSERWSEKAGRYVPLDSDAEISRYVWDALHGVYVPFCVRPG